MTPSEAKDFHWVLRNTVRNERGCREWVLYKNAQGYGYTSLYGRMYIVARFMYEQIFGPIQKGMYVCHHCDNPTCVAPYHLFLGTAKDNMRDAVKKGRIYSTTKWKDFKGTLEI